jgi:23S rRNA (pseudouridine1915-N3)-methyltransferase
VRAVIISVCERLPAWVKHGFDDYAERLQKDLPITCVDVALGQRSNTHDLSRALTDEGRRMQAAIGKNSRVISLDGEGKKHSSESLAVQLAKWREDGRDLAFLIGGPDGLARNCLDLAEHSISLGELTLPHAIVRIVLAEQLFRAHCILQNHPYHRAVKARHIQKL